MTILRASNQASDAHLSKATHLTPASTSRGDIPPLRLHTRNRCCTRHGPLSVPARKSVSASVPTKTRTIANLTARTQDFIASGRCASISAPQHTERAVARPAAHPLRTPQGGPNSCDRKPRAPHPRTALQPSRSATERRKTKVGGSPSSGRRLVVGPAIHVVGRAAVEDRLRGCVRQLADVQSLADDTGVAHLRPARIGSVSATPRSSLTRMRDDSLQSDDVPSRARDNRTILSDVQPWATN